MGAAWGMGSPCFTLSPQLLFQEEAEKISGRKKSKPKKSKEEEEEEDRGEKEKRKPSKQQQQQRGKAKPNGINELEAFLGGGAGASKQRGGGDYEEL